MEGFAAIGGLIVLAVVSVWIAIAEAKTGATRKETIRVMKEVIDATQRFNEARRESRGLSRRARIERMLQAIRTG